MCLLLAFLRQLDMLRRSIVGNSRNSRFGRFNSRFGRQKFPIGLLREFARKGLIWLAILGRKQYPGRTIGKNSRLDGNYREMVVTLAVPGPAFNWSTRPR